MKAICQELKNVAVDTGLPIVLGAQFNRTVENHLHLFANRIGEAGDIERIANLIVGIWNNAFTPTGEKGEMNEIKNKNLWIEGSLYATIIKNRGGEVGEGILLNYNGNTGKISNVSEQPSFFSSMN